ncbi:rhamnan synthesis F family protein [Butyrivibrio sp. INlla21]|uniref:rhamnan synthesis F family protein n=1 Tax=Butyrivibrio sp. INlla21 TaxID=1520811 RepID=UPI0008ECE4D5|nr:rhamnan synthesis F family protein [Butyrivibrio sp. INlla21]SFV03795.1 Rhamnan synthesis protein F [Butyrivibrio sp. INlla21]
MKRVCVYVIYDKQNIVNPYIGKVLSELSKFASDIFVVCNFSHIVSGEEYVTAYAKDIFYRENIGYDAGAYKDALIRFITWNRIKEYDELILTNDTYFGPLYPFEEMFGVMDLMKCDFWGITRHPGGDLEEVGCFGQHIQSYFLCFKDRIVHDPRFEEYWEEYSYKDDKLQTIANFELGINGLLNNIGYIGASYMDSTNVPIRHGANPYNTFAYELIKDGRIPIIKKTNFYGKNRALVNALKALDYIKKHCDYDASLITDYVEEYKKKGLIGPYYDFERLEEFVKSHRRVFIYGSGNWGHITADYITSKGLTYEAFVVTKAKDDSVIEFDSIDIKDTDGIIIAQEYKNICDEIIDFIGMRVKRVNIFTPCYPQVN